MKRNVMVTLLAGMVFLVGCMGRGVHVGDGDVWIKAVGEELIQLEMRAIERGNEGDIEGFLELYSEDYSYFDPYQPGRVDSLDAIRAIYEPLKGTVYDGRSEMVRPRVQLRGDVGVLTFRLVSYNKDGKEESRWNATEVYAKEDGQWKIIHSHWAVPK